MYHALARLSRVGNLAQSSAVVRQRHARNRITLITILLRGGQFVCCRNGAPLCYPALPYTTPGYL